MKRVKRRLAVCITTVMAMAFTVIPAVGDTAAYADESGMKMLEQGTTKTNIENLSIDLYFPNSNGTSALYDGTEQVIEIAITDEADNYELREGEDYTVKYRNNIEVTFGKTEKAVAVIEGIGRYCGTVEESFDIEPLNFRFPDWDEYWEDNDPPDYLAIVGLSAYNYSYDGKVHTPAVSVKSLYSCKNIPKKDYVVSYAKGRKNVGTYKVKVSASKTENCRYYEILNFKINPKATSISDLKKERKGFKVKWKKVSKQATGYQVQWATDSKFTKNKKTVTVKSYKTTSKTIKKLKAKKKYYVKVRTYKKVGKTTYYSPWSKKKTVITK